MSIPIAYTFSPLLKDLCASIDQYRLIILTTPLQPKKERTLRYQATTERILTVLREASVPMTATELNRLLTTPPKRPHPIDMEALVYRQALGYIQDEWTGQPKQLTVPIVEVLMHIGMRFSFPRISRIMDKNTTDMNRLIAYIDAQSDHPVLIAGVVHAVMSQTELNTISRGRIAFLMSSLIFAKYGYDCRGMLAAESTLIRDHKAYDHALTSISNLGQMTVWLEYYAQMVLNSYGSLQQKIDGSSGKQADTSRSLTTLNDRQKQIIFLLDSPAAKVTNREVQKRFKISQITASRDLTNLVSQGFLTSSGKGRSIHYTLA